MAETRQRRLFADRRDGSLGLGLFLNAGDPPLPVLAEVVTMLDEQGVDCLELAVPFPDSPTDGPVIRRSADRALRHRVDLGATLAFVAETVPRLCSLEIVVLADYSHTVRPYGLGSFVSDVAASGAAATLLHGVPPRVRGNYHAAAAEAGLPVVTTCYHDHSDPATVLEAARQATAFVYLVSRWGRSGGSSPPAVGLARTVDELRQAGPRPVAVGFGVRTASDVARIRRAGADAVLVGSAGVATLENSLNTGADVVADLSKFVNGLRSASPLLPLRPQEGSS